jgi:hypothetical protein
LHPVGNIIVIVPCPHIMSGHSLPSAFYSQGCSTCQMWPRRFLGLLPRREGVAYSLVIDEETKSVDWFHAVPPCACTCEMSCMRFIPTMLGLSWAGQAFSALAFLNLTWRFIEPRLVHTSTTCRRPLRRLRPPTLLMKGGRP